METLVAVEDTGQDVFSAKGKEIFAYLEFYKGPCIWRWRFRRGTSPRYLRAAGCLAGSHISTSSTGIHG